MAYMAHIIIDEVCVILSYNIQRVVGYTFTTDCCESQREAALRVLYQRHVLLEISVKVVKLVAIIFHNTFSPSVQHTYIVIGDMFILAKFVQQL